MSLQDTLRQMTGVSTTTYSIGSTAYWSDDQLSAVLAERVSGNLVQLPVNLIPSIDESNHVVWVHGHISRYGGSLDTDSVILTDIGGVVIPSDDYTVHEDGRVEFEVDRHAQPVYASGLAFDLNGAAADVLEAFAAAVMQGYDVTMDGQQLSRSQRHEQITKQADRYRSMALPSVIRLTRPDLRRRRGGSLAGRLLPWFEQIGKH